MFKLHTVKTCFIRAFEEGFYIARFFMNAFIISCSFITVIPIKKFPDWNKNNLRFFCVTLPFVGCVIGLLWAFLFWILFSLTKISVNLKGVIMSLLTLAITGGLHMDGFIDSCDAIFSHRDLKKRLEILSDSHVGAFGVICCSGILILKCALFSELFTKFFDLRIFFVPVLSRIGLAILLNNLDFAKNDGLARSLGNSRNKKDNIFFIIMIILISIMNPVISTGFFLVLFSWSFFCVKIFNGITGDLLGAFVEISEVIILFSMVIEFCIS